MKWLKVPLDDETYAVLRMLAEVTGSSPEEIVMKIATGSLKGYVRLMAEGKEEEIRNMFLSPVAKAAIEEALKMEFPEEPRLWLPQGKEVR